MLNKVKSAFGGKKRLAFLVAACLLVFGLVRVDLASAEDEQDFCQVTPGVWVLDEDGTTGNEQVTVHYAVPYSSVNLESLKITVGEVENIVFNTFADDRGDLVIKFYPEQENLEVGGPYPVLVTGNDLLGEPLEECADEVSVKDMGPAKGVVEE